MKITIRKRTFIIIPLLAVLLFVIGQLVTRANRSGSVARPPVDPVERIYELDPARKMIGTRVDNFAFADLVSGKTVRLSELADKIVIFEGFSVGCPACAAGIEKYNQIYDKYAPRVQIVYLNLNPADTALDIFDIKTNYQGRDWIWVKNSPELAAFLGRYKIVDNEMTYILKNNEIVYADSLSAPIERIENALRQALAL